jgi:hypothetical protein
MYSSIQFIIYFTAVKRKDFEVKDGQFSSNVLCSFYLCKYGFNLLVVFPKIWNLSNFQRIFLAISDKVFVRSFNDDTNMYT